MAAGFTATPQAAAARAAALAQRYDSWLDGGVRASAGRRADGAS